MLVASLSSGNEHRAHKAPALSQSLFAAVGRSVTGSALSVLFDNFKPGGMAKALPLEGFGQIRAGPDPLALVCADIRGNHTNSAAKVQRRAMMSGPLGASQPCLCTMAGGATIHSSPETCGRHRWGTSRPRRSRRTDVAMDVSWCCALPDVFPVTTPFRFVDLFAGIGGIRMGLERAGGTCVYSVEIDRFARETYETNFRVCEGRDIHDVRGSDLPPYDVLAAGFPCQPFSLAGVSKKVSLGRLHGFEDKKSGNLFFEIVRIIEEAPNPPPVLLLENVKNLISHDKGVTFRVVRDTLKRLGTDSATASSTLRAGFPSIASGHSWSAFTAMYSAKTPSSFLNPHWIFRADLRRYSGA